MSRSHSFHLVSSILIACLTCMHTLSAQDNNDKFIEFGGQLSSYGLYAPDYDNYTILGGRYIPELDIRLFNNGNASVDCQFSVDLYGYVGYQDNNQFLHYGKISPYRAWVRYRTEKLELRAGLQKIDFGSASILRPLQWFNSNDPRDPLNITNGVWAILGKYYWLDNTNLWLWCLSLNDDYRGIDILNSDKYLPEFGGRLQTPIPSGEIAISYNHRWADAKKFAESLTGETDLSIDPVQEDKIGLDAKWDITVGVWFEATYTYLHRPLFYLQHQEALNIGVDYTFATGNGLNASMEHLFYSYDENAYALKNLKNITAARVSYPVSLFDNLSLMTLYAWESGKIFGFLSYKHSFKQLSLYTNLYYTPNIDISFLERSYYFIGKGMGIQIMLVYNH